MTTATLRGLFYHLIFGVRNKILLYRLRLMTFWYRFLQWRFTFQKTTFITLTIIFICIGIGLGMAWRAHQVEPRLKAELFDLQVRNESLRQERNKFIGQVIMWETIHAQLAKKGKK